MGLTLTSSAFVNGGEIPARYTCEGEDISPPLAWKNIPNGCQSLVLIVDDPDAPDPQAPKMTWVHWIVYDIPPDSNGLPENATVQDVAPGAEEGVNDWKRTGYGGPCPPVGRHRYFHKLYALDSVLSHLHKADKRAVEAAMQDHILASAELVGTYQKSK